MKKIILSSIVLLASFCISSFTSSKGGEGFEIYLNSKLVLQQFGSKVNEVKSIQLDQSSPNDELMIKYYHCGQVGKNRSIVIRDGQNKILKEWHFADVSKGSSAMTCKVKDIIGLGKGKEKISLNLFYSSTELPAGRQLVTLVVPAPSLARL